MSLPKGSTASNVHRRLQDTQLIAHGAELEGVRENEHRQVEERRTMADELKSSDTTDGGDPDAKLCVDVQTRWQADEPILPLELLDYIAKLLTDDYQFGTCASLNVCSHDVHISTLATLWHTVYLRTAGNLCTEVLSPLFDRLSQCKGGKHIRQVRAAPLPCYMYTDYGLSPRRMHLPSSPSHRFIDVAFPPTKDNAITRIPFHDTIKNAAESLHHSLPKVKALICSTEQKLQVHFRPTAIKDVYLQHTFEPGTIDDLNLWAVIASRCDNINSMKVWAPSNDLESHVDDVHHPVRILPFPPSRRPWIRRMNVDAETANLTAMSSAIHAALAIHSYSRNFWGTSLGDIERESENIARGRGDRPNGTLVIHSSTGHAALRSCIQALVPAFTSNPKFVELGVEIQYLVDRHQTMPALNHVERIALARSESEAFRLIEAAYKSACQRYTDETLGVISVCAEDHFSLDLKVSFTIAGENRMPTLSVRASYFDDDLDDYVEEDLGPL